MIVRENQDQIQKDFQLFQDILKIMKYEHIPNTPNECWGISGTELCEQLKHRFKVTPQDLAAMSRFTTIEKYYFSSMVMFPTLYMCYGDECKDLNECSKEELIDFENQLQEALKVVYENQPILANQFADIGSNLLSRMLPEER